ncbi:trigger factor [Moorella sp. E308F]|jgi:trigger factor|uniref:trigger factor n=1 Tax=unclassified Neomoorella TaxID=2676739 RepID=UPI0010FFBC04|nr:MULTISPECIES: trigger factor [unclassified Moorella (in: firmicutes)]GEA16395.1 trigger factor [Moorella sp. E308F]GEA17427.1 trigger factor [Moorella sp. E306M]
MKATVEKLDKHQVLLEIEVEAPRVQKALDQAYRRLVKRVNIPGFRKGKAPRFILERYIGKEPIYNEAVEIVIPPAYKEAVAEHQLEPIDHPEVEIVKVEEGEPLIFKARVEVKPEVHLGTYKGLEVERPEVKVSEEDIDAYLKSLQERYATIKNIEDEPAAAGDIVVIDFKGTVEGQPYPGLEGNNYHLELGSGTFVPGFEEQLVGARLNEERTVTVTFPADYHKEDLAGKEAVFQVAIRGIKRKELAPLDDEFAKDVSECETLAELRQDIRRRLEERQRQEIDAAVRQAVVAKAVAAATVDLPEIMVKRRIESRLRELERNLHARKITLGEFLNNTGKTMDDLEKEFQPGAERDVKTELVLEAIAKAENIAATEEDIEAEIEKMARIFRQDAAEVRKNLGDLSLLKYDIMIKKTIDFLVEHSVAVPPREGGEGETGETAATEG